MIEGSRSFYNIAPIFRFKIKKTHNRSFSGCKAVPNFSRSFMLVTGGPNFGDGLRTQQVSQGGDCGYQRIDSQIGRAGSRAVAAQTSKPPTVPSGH